MDPLPNTSARQMIYRERYCGNTFRWERCSLYMWRRASLVMIVGRPVRLHHPHGWSEADSPFVSDLTPFSVHGVLWFCWPCVVSRVRVPPGKKSLVSKAIKKSTCPKWVAWVVSIRMASSLSSKVTRYLVSWRPRSLDEPVVRNQQSGLQKCFAFVPAVPRSSLTDKTRSEWRKVSLGYEDPPFVEVLTPRALWLMKAKRLFRMWKLSGWSCQ